MARPYSLDLRERVRETNESEPYEDASLKIIASSKPEAFGPSASGRKPHRRSADQERFQSNEYVRILNTDHDRKPTSIWHRLVRPNYVHLRDGGS
jgi:hypothetical protein